MRRRGRQSQRDYSREVVSGEIEKAMINRMKLLSPFPLDPMEVHQAIIEPEIHAAAAIIQNWNGTMLERDHTLPIQWRTSSAPVVTNPFANFARGQRGSVVLKDFMAAAYRPKLVMVTLPYTDYLDRPYMPDRPNFFMGGLPHVMREKLTAWAEGYIKHRTEMLAIKRLTDDVFNVCNTMGQVKRVWPNLMNFMPTEARQKVEAMVKQSKLPDGFEYNQAPGEIYHYKNIEAYDVIITEALILPYDKDAKMLAEITYERC
jgi:hypothetical protein